MTPLQAIRKVCVGCVGCVYEVKDCGGDKCLGAQGDENGVCYFFSFRLGKGRPSVKTIRKFCLECMGGSNKLIAECGICQIVLYIHIASARVQPGQDRSIKALSNRL